MNIQIKNWNTIGGSRNFMPFEPELLAFKIRSQFTVSVKKGMLLPLGQLRKV
ncbi:hypothetical protein [Dyadobacter sp. CY356]|uniref:hypothetical protein n=1 Tax=Dyadobacter sp. CY356 TaxID=2906442 RepID=UPI001F167D6A|nr:hypothetical protein [Dyadobacter sp. CY356]MCF0058463.1 hypothetical protein [Dyadobacter sp. CY356]